MNIGSMNCCGLRELSNLSGSYSPREAMQNFLQVACPRGGRYSWNTGKHTYVNELRFSHVIFSEAKNGSGNYGERFAAYIRRNNLGDVVASGRRVNPNSGNQVKCWVWTLNKRALIAWANKNIKSNTRFGISV